VLVINGKLRRRADDDDGAVLITVVVVMLVGFIIAVTVAASVMFTIEANVGNKDRTQAFVAAESGRDAAVGEIRSKLKLTPDGKKVQVDCVVDPPAMTDSGTAPNYEFTILTTDKQPSVPDAPETLVDSDWASTCPNNDTKWVKIVSTGWQVETDRITVDSIYRWRYGPSTTPSGTVAFFEGEFTATKSTYAGDLVIREGPYECNNGASGGIQGDLWVLRGTMTVTDTCIVTGSVYVRDQISVGNKQLKVGGDLISLEGVIKLNGNSVEIGGDVYAAGNIDTKTGSGVVKGSFKTPADMVDHDPADWTNGATPPVAVAAFDDAPAPMISPTLEQVYEATRWIELTSTTAWSSIAMPVDAPPPGTVCTTAQLQAALSTAGTRAVIDMTGCPSGGSGIRVDLGNVTVARDAVILVPANEKMDLQLDGTISRPGSTTLETGPQLLIVHLDPNGSDNRPPSCASSDLDKFTAGTNNSVRTLVYSACGIGSTMPLTMSGQLYMGSDGLHLNGGTFTCVPMSWPPTLPTISCGIKGSGGIFDPENTKQQLEDLKFQTER
jgi:Tfp pilus assembly protein PilX